MNRENPRLVIVTGGSRGIGAAISRLAGFRGYLVAVNFLRNEEAARGVVDQIVSSGGSAIPLQGDVAEEGDIVRLFEKGRGKYSSSLQRRWLTAARKQRALLLPEPVQQPQIGSAVCYS